MTQAAQPTEGLDHHLTLPEVAKRLSLSTRSIFKLRDQGHFTGAFRINGTGNWRFPESDVQDFIHFCREQTHAAS